MYIHNITIIYIYIKLSWWNLLKLLPLPQLRPQLDLPRHHRAALKVAVAPPKPQKLMVYQCWSSFVQHMSHQTCHLGKTLEKNRNLALPWYTPIKNGNNTKRWQWGCKMPEISWVAKRVVLEPLGVPSPKCRKTKKGIPQAIQSSSSGLNHLAELP